MTQKCRFCQGKTIILFPPNRKVPKNVVNAFTCTNCGFGTHGQIVKCLACQIIYVNEAISQEKISTYYEVAQDPVYFKEQDARKITFNNYLKKLEKQFPRKGRLLDVGTNTGLFVKLARDAGWDALGIEPNLWSVDYAKKNYKIDLVNKPFEKGVFKPGEFNVVTMWDVVEHFIDPVSEMKKVLWYLKPGGLFAFSTIDPNSFLAKLMGTRWSWYMEMHRVFFNKYASKKYLVDLGFGKIIFKSHWRNLSLGYLATRLAAVNDTLAFFMVKLAKALKMSEIIVPYYANDLYDCYAYKKNN